jgi:hypothetical protein
LPRKVDNSLAKQAVVLETTVPKDSLRESMALDAVEEQAISRRYRTKNLSSYNASLRKRGALLIWGDKDMTWRAPRDGLPGRPALFSDAAI